MKSRKILSIIGLILAAAVLLGIGFAVGRNEVQASVPDATDAAEDIVHTGDDVPALNLTVTRGGNTDSQIFSPEEIGNNFNQGMSYWGVTDVSISLNSGDERLEDALKNGDITEEEIFFRARQDARDGRCQETFETQHGVTFYNYHYPDYDLWLVYDVFNSPNGKAYPVSQLIVFRTTPDYHLHPSCAFTDPETGAFVNREDWGLTFELSDITSHSATVTCTQSGGQQIGQLEVRCYTLHPDTKGIINPPKFETEIAMDGTCQFSVDWSETYGDLPSGTYRLYLWVYDIYDESQLHPLMDDFQDWQVLDVELIIP
jgi:hypothetical protein